MKENIFIKPIFVQTPDVWRDFADTESRALKPYKYRYNSEDIKNVIHNHKFDWVRAPLYNFAFGAYNGNKMVGFAKAFLCVDNYLFLDSLYIDYLYQNMGLGRRLLTNIENAGALVSDSISLFSLSRAYDFYECLGYKKALDSADMVKNITAPTFHTVPLFNIAKKNNFKFNFDIDIMELIPYKCCPKYAYIGSNRQIDAIAINTNGKDIQYFGKSACRSALQSAFDFQR